MPTWALDMSSGFRPAAYSIAFEPGWPTSSVRRALVRLILMLMVPSLAHVVGQHTQPVDLDLHPVPALEVDRRLAGEAHPGRRAGGDDVARLERGRGGQELDQLGHPEHQLVGARVLHQLAVEAQLDGQAVRVLDLVAGGHEGAHG